ncbi:MAG: glycosyltransferase family 2 protein [Bacteroidales bacterium]|nr:glycosyltransferase family 2 protein [Bacteroidales bacterium]
MPKISVIVAVYNAEKYMHRCVDSLLNQTFKDFEILLIDDGSPDRSGEICDEYAKNDSRVRVFHKENGGVSSARQMGIDNAQGEYTIHADPDDWCDTTMLEEMYSRAVSLNVDVVMVDFYHEMKNHTLKTSSEPTEESSNAVLHDMIIGDVWGTLWAKLVRTSCYREYDVKFPKGINLWEDLYVCCSLFKNPITVSYLPKAYYHYDNTSNEGSLVRNKTLKSVYHQDYFIKHFADIMTEEELYYRKQQTLLRAFYVMNGSDLRKLYPEINNLYVHKHKYDFTHPEALSCAWVLLNCPKKIIYLIYRFLEFFAEQYRRIRRHIK